MNQVVLVGAGCGKETITLQALRLLCACDCVVYDSLLDDSLLKLCRQDCRKIFVGKRSGRHSASQQEINEILISCGKEYPLTVRLKGGDPFVFGRGGEELLALQQAGIAGYAVPGVSSCIAAAELAGIPVTHRGLAQGFQVHTAHTADKEIDFTELGRSADTLVFLMAKQTAGSIQQDLLKGGMSPDMPIALLSQAGSEQFSVKRETLSQLKSLADSLSPPLTVLVGKVCGMQLASDPPKHSEKPLVAVTGTPAHVQRVRNALLDRGILSLDCGYSQIKALDFDPFFSQMDGFSWLVFTSGNGVDLFFRRVKELQLDLRKFGNKKFAAIGHHTAERLAHYGFTADLIPAAYTAQSLCEKLLALNLPKDQIALLRAKVGNPVLLQAGVQFDVYETVTDSKRLEAVAEQISKPEAGIGAITFGSAGGARALLDVCELPRKMVPICIGAETAAELSRRGYRPEVAAQSTSEALAEQTALLWEERKWNV